MTLVHDVDDLAGAGAAATRGRLPLLRRVWAAPLRVHVAALAVVLLALVPLVGSGASFSADEGAAIIQARSLAAGHGWVVAHPMPEVDPTGAHYPLELSERGPQGTAPFGKHPLYALLLAGADRLGGVAAMVVLSVLGAVAAAGLAGALARRIAPGLARPTVWVVGLASPLLFDGYLVVAHTLAAAAAVGALLAAVVAVERRRPAAALAVGPLVAVAVLLRTEAVFFALALAAVASVAAWRRPASRTAALLVAAGAVLAGAVAHVGERTGVAHLVGGAPVPGGPTHAAVGPTGLAGRIQGFAVTWLTPGYGGHALASAALLVMVGAIAVGAATMRSRPDRAARITGAAAVAAAAALVAAVTGRGTVVPGLLVAFPVLLAGLILVRRSAVETVAARMAAAAAGLFALAVVATQYANGGGGEWGGRYFSLALPLVVPVLLLALRDAGRRLDPRLRPRIAAALVACSVALAVMGVAALRSSHQANAGLVAAVERAGHAVGDPRPVVLTTQGSMPRFAWSTFDGQRWLLAQPDDVGALLGQLRQAGVARLVFVSKDLAQDRAHLGARVTVVSDTRAGTGDHWEILVLQIG